MESATQKLMHHLDKVWVAWFIAYFLLGGFALMNRSTSFLAEPVDHIANPWISGIFFNIPLQLLLVFTALSFRKTNHVALQRVGNFSACLVTILIAVNLVTALVIIG